MTYVWGIIPTLLLSAAAMAADDPADLLQRAHIAADQSKFKDAAGLVKRANAAWSRGAVRHEADYADALVLQAAALLRAEVTERRPVMGEVEILAQWEKKSAELLDRALAIPEATAEVRALALELGSKQQRNVSNAGNMQQEAAGLHVKAVEEIIPARDGEQPRGSEDKKEGPRLVLRTQPVSPLTARALRLAGKVTLGLIIEVDGTPSTVELKVAQGWGMDEAAARALKQWRFKPATRDGVPARVAAQVEIVFRLQ